VRRVLALAVLLPLGLCPVPPRSSAQAPERTVRIGVLGSRPSASIAAFQEALRELGHVEGRNITFEYRWADGGIPQLRPLADEMVRLRVDLIFAPGTVAALAAKAATTEIPIVFAVVADPVGEKLVAGLSRPGANIVSFR